MNNIARRTASLKNALKNMAFVFLSAVIAAVIAERVFWFWSPGLVDHLHVSAFYAFPVACTFWTMSRYRVNGLWPLLLATPIFGYVVEGVITPVMYTGGPFVPFFPAWFGFWHGILAFGILLLAVRHWLLANARGPLLATATATGLFWGVWASTLRTPDNAEDPELIEHASEALTVLDPQAFTGYAALFTAVVIVSHWLIGYVWPRTYAPGKVHTVVLGGLCLAGAAAWSVVVPWALPMFVAYVFLQRWGLRRHRAQADGPDLFEQLHGRVRLQALLPLVAMAPTAAITYAVIWQLDPSVLALQVIYYSVIAVQTLAGAAITITALRKSHQIFKLEPAARVPA